MEIVEGDLLDPGSLRGGGGRGPARLPRRRRLPALGAGPRSELYRANVDGTRHLLEAAAEAGAERIVYTSTVGALGIPKDGTPGDETTPVSLEDMVGALQGVQVPRRARGRRVGGARGADRHRQPVGADRPVGRQAHADRADDRGLPPRQDGRLGRHRPQRRPRARRGARPHPGRRAGPGGARSYILGHRNLSLIEIFRMLSRAHRRAARRGSACPTRVAWMAAVVHGRRRPASPAARPAVPLTAVRMARKRMYFSAAKAVRELGLPQTPCRRRPARRGRLVRRRAATRPGPPGSRWRERDAVRLAAHAQEPLELLLRLPLPAAAPARGASTPCYAFCRIVDDAVDLGQDRARAARGARALARGDRARLRGAAGASGRPAAAGGGAALPDPARGARGDHRGRGDGPRPLRPTRPSTSSIPTATAWPPRSGSAASRSSATRTRARASTR